MSGRRVSPQAVASFLRGWTPRQAVALDDSGQGDYYLFHDRKPWSTGTGWGCGARHRGRSGGTGSGDVRRGRCSPREEGVYTLDGTAAWLPAGKMTPH